MKPFTLCYYTAASMEIPSLGIGVREFQKTGGKVKVYARTKSQLFDSSRIASFVKHALESHVVIISLHGGKESCPAFDELVAEIQSRRAIYACNQASALVHVPYLHIYPTGGDEDALETSREHSDQFGTEQWATINRYIAHSGGENFKNLLYYLQNLILGTEMDVPPPVKQPQEGIYHPDFHYTPSLDEYLAEKIIPDKPVVGLWFYQSYWLNRDLEHIDAIIREVERQGASVIPVFHLRYKDAERGNRGADYIVKEFFMDGDRPRIDVLINPMLFSLTLAAPEYKELLPKLGVPFIQAICSMSSFDEWNEGYQGISTMDVSYAVAQPEFDGALITVPVSFREEKEIDPVTGALIARSRPMPERIHKMVSLSLNWARLRKKRNEEKKVAIVFHNYPPRNDRIGCAAGLDSFESIKCLLDRLKSEGYRVEKLYECGDDLAKDILGRVTCDQRWLTPERMAEKAEAVAGQELYGEWYRNLPEDIKKKMSEDWGEIPGDIFVHDKKMLFPGLVNGNVFITIQPPRGYLENIDKVYHDFYLSPPHHYLAHYRWIKYVFKADVVMHVGKHGSLEWLPGKALGLSDTCYPDLAIMDLPNVYPYIINDPSEGTQAKRRSYCCIIDHLTPVFSNADLYEDLAKVENLLNDYSISKREDPGKLDILRPMIWEAVCEADLDKDLDITEEKAFSDFDGFLEQLHAYLSELADTMINDGLHVMGCVPEKERMVEFLVQLTRLSNGDVPSLREAILKADGYSYDELLENRGKVLPQFGGKTGGQIITEAHEKALLLVKELAEKGFNKDCVESSIQSLLGRFDPEINKVLIYICSNLVPSICQVIDEIDASITAFSGGFVPPGPSGAPTRGQADILPTGRNFYSVDPRKIPSPAAWETGRKLGDSLLERYLSETGNYPETVGIIIWGGSTMRTKGDDVAEVLYLMGVKPVWSKGSGEVSGLEIIPHSELGRPRIDVVPRISGFFRDSFPNLVELMDEAARMVAALEEPPEANILRRNVLRDMDEYMKEGMTKEDAFREATFRIFGCPPGTYGAGVSELVESKNWKTQEDLGNNYIRYSSHAYGKESYGKQRISAFRNVLSRMEVTVKNEDSREYDMMSCTDYYNYYGGLIVAVKTVRGKLPYAIVGDSADPKRIKMRTTFEEAKHVLRARLTNPKWLEGMKRHGYKGAGDISHMMDVILGWDATAEVIDDWMYDRIAHKFALDPEMQKWMKEVNPYALQNILDKLLEAISRGMWNADEETEEKLRDAYLEMEGQIEEVTE